MLRTAEREVTLEVCRPPPGTFTLGEDISDGGSGVISTSLTLPSTSHQYLSPSPSFSSCGVRNSALKVHYLLLTCVSGCMTPSCLHLSSALIFLFFKLDKPFISIVNGETCDSVKLSKSVFLV